MIANDNSNDEDDIWQFNYKAWMMSDNGYLEWLNEGERK